mmetsp:Transcript_8214/g.19568  ORF Transcript_8214/g.19568 Transcript_8214/m.19568 type:complete len:206 (-) Transcript_8214:75-692(-)
MNSSPAMIGERKIAKTHQGTGSSTLTSSISNTHGYCPRSLSTPHSISVGREAGTQTRVFSPSRISSSAARQLCSTSETSNSSGSEVRKYELSNISPSATVQPVCRIQTLEPLPGTVAPFLGGCRRSVAMPVGRRLRRTLGLGPWYFTTSNGGAKRGSTFFFFGSSSKFAWRATGLDRRCIVAGHGMKPTWSVTMPMLKRSSPGSL